MRQAAFDRKRQHQLVKGKIRQDQMAEPTNYDFFGGDLMPKWMEEDARHVHWWKYTPFLLDKSDNIRIYGDDGWADDGTQDLEHARDESAHRKWAASVDQSEYLTPPTLVQRYFGRRRVSDAGGPAAVGIRGKKIPTRGEKIWAEKQKRREAANKKNVDVHSWTGPPFWVVMPKAAPVWTFGILLVCCLILLLEIWAGGMDKTGKCPTLGPDEPTLLAMGARYGPMLRDGDFWRFASCLMLHQGVVQFMVACVLHIMSWHFEYVWGFWKAIGVWLLSGIYGQILSAVAVPLEIAVGSTAGVMGWVGVELVDLISDWGKTDSPAKILILNIFLALLAFVGGFLHLIDNWAHVGGLGLGALMSLLLLPGANFTNCATVCRGLVAFVAFPLASFVFMMTMMMFYQMTDVDSMWCVKCYRLNCWNFTGWCVR
jgi:membrane associated rhomboid family serine protease